MRKTRKRIIFIIIIISIFFAVISFILTCIYSFQSKNIKKIALEGHFFYTEIVSDRKKLEKGLGERENLCDSCAMLFEFSEPGKHPFWMKGMRFPLDIIWIRNGEVVYIEKNISENFSDILFSPVDSDCVLEINAGNVDELKIKIGSKILKNYQ